MGLTRQAGATLAATERDACRQVSEGFEDAQDRGSTLGVRCRTTFGVTWSGCAGTCRAGGVTAWPLPLIHSLRSFLPAGSRDRNRTRIWPEISDRKPNRHRLATSLGIVASLAWSSGLAAQEVGAARAPGPIEIDGVLTEAEWSEAAAIEAFTQLQPVAGAPASQRTGSRRRSGR